MRHLSRLALLAPLALAARTVRTAAAQAPRALVERAALAMGGADALRRVTNVTYDYSQVAFALGQEEGPFAPAGVTIGLGRFVIDYAAQRRLATLETRPTVLGVAGNRQRAVLASGVVVTETNGTAAPDLRGAALGASQRVMRLYPDRLILSAIDNATALAAAPPRTWAHAALRGVHYALGLDTLDLYFDDATGLPAIMVQLLDDPVLGDRANVTSYQRWLPTGGVLLPRQVDVTANDRPVSQLLLVSAAVNSTLADSLFAVPADVAARSSSTVLTPLPIAVQLTELARGVWHLSGGTHNSLVVEQPSSLILVEAPLGAARMKAVFDTLASRFPKKPVRLVVATHHHFDHSGGVREALARHIPVLTHARNGEFVRLIGLARKTLAPDALSKSRRGITVRTMGDTLTIGEGAGRVQVFAMKTVHVLGLLAAYVPSAQVVFTSDVVNPQPLPAALPAAGSRELVAFAESHGLTVKSYAGGHGRVVAWDELMRAAR